MLGEKKEHEKRVIFNSSFQTTEENCTRRWLKDVILVFLIYFHIFYFFGELPTLILTPQLLQASRDQALGLSR